MIPEYLLTAQTYVILTFAGYGLTSLFIPKRLRKYALWLCPWYGTALIVSLGTILNLARVTMMRGPYVTLAFCFILFVYTALSQKLVTFSSASGLFFLLFLLLTFVGLVFVWLPTDFWKDYSIREIGFYGEKVDFLLNHSVLDSAILDKSFVENVNQIGVSSLLAFFFVITNQPFGVIVNILAMIYLILSSLLIVILAATIYKSYQKSHLPVIAVVMITTVVSFYLLTKLIDVGLTRLIFFGVVAFTMVLLYDHLLEIWDAKVIFNNFLHHEFIIAFNLSSLAVIHPQAFRLFLLAIVFFSLGSFFAKKRKALLLTVGKVALLTIIINPVMIGIALR